MKFDYLWSLVLKLSVLKRLSILYNGMDCLMYKAKSQIFFYYNVWFNEHNTNNIKLDRVFKQPHKRKKKTRYFPMHIFETLSIYLEVQITTNYHTWHYSTYRLCRDFWVTAHICQEQPQKMEFPFEMLIKELKVLKLEISITWLRQCIVETWLSKALALNLNFIFERVGVLGWSIRMRTREKRLEDRGREGGDIHVKVEETSWNNKVILCNNKYMHGDQLRQGPWIEW